MIELMEMIFVTVLVIIGGATVGTWIAKYFDH